jgi:hypothetical protein
MKLDQGGRSMAARALFLAAALLSFGLSVALYFTGEHTDEQELADRSIAEVRE